MSTALVVTMPFANREIGDRITNQADVQAALESNPHHVRRITVADPKPAATKAGE